MLGCRLPGKGKKVSPFRTAAQKGTPIRYNRYTLPDPVQPLRLVWPQSERERFRDEVRHEGTALQNKPGFNRLPKLRIHLTLEIFGFFKLPVTSETEGFSSRIVKNRAIKIGAVGQCAPGCTASIATIFCQ